MTPFSGHEGQEVSEHGFVYGSKRWKSQFSVDSQLRTQLTKQLPQSSSKVIATLPADPLTCPLMQKMFGILADLCCQGCPTS